MRGFAQRAGAIGETLGDVPLQVAAQYHLSWLATSRATIAGPNTSVGG
jgi:hypothetical protein